MRDKRRFIAAVGKCFFESDGKMFIKVNEFIHTCNYHGVRADGLFHHIEGVKSSIRRSRCNEKALRIAPNSFKTHLEKMDFKDLKRYFRPAKTVVFEEFRRKRAESNGRPPPKSSLGLFRERQKFIKSTTCTTCKGLGYECYECKWKRMVPGVKMPKHFKYSLNFMESY